MWSMEQGTHPLRLYCRLPAVWQDVLHQVSDFQYGSEALIEA